MYLRVQKWYQFDVFGSSVQYQELSPCNAHGGKCGVSPIIYPLVVLQLLWVAVAHLKACHSIWWDLYFKYSSYTMIISIFSHLSGFSSGLGSPAWSFSVDTNWWISCTTGICSHSDESAADESLMVEKISVTFPSNTMATKRTIWPCSVTYKMESRE